MKALVTGSEGFVGKYLREELANNGYEVVGLDIVLGKDTVVVDLLNASQVEETIKTVCPDVIIHLAGQADVGLSWMKPSLTFQLNVVAASNLLEAARKYAPKAKIVLVGSSDEYGSLGALGRNVTEDIPLNPQTPYAISKQAQEQLAVLYSKNYSMNICCTRSFNHSGAGQKLGFLIPDFASGVADIERGNKAVLKVGNLESKRDFTNVRDIVRAYRLIAEKGQSGEIYNVGSGGTYSAKEILDKLLLLSNMNIPVEQDPSKMRPSDTPVVCCNHYKLTMHTGWQPEIDIDTTLKEVLEYYRNATAKQIINGD